MKAAQLISIGDSHQAFKINEINKPSIKANEILIKVETFGLNYADVMARNGIYAAAPPLPSVLGYEAVGTVAQIGEHVKNINIGDRVIGFTRFGAYAEFCVSHMHATRVLPKEIDNAQGCALATQYCTAIYAADWMAHIKSFETILIHAAAGGVGNALIQVAKKRNCTIIATAGSPEKIAYLKSIGVDHCVNYLNDNYEDVVNRITDSKGVDVIFDPIGGPNFKPNNRLLRVGGRMILYGISSFSKKKGTLLDKIQLFLQFGILSPLSFLIKSNGIIGVNMLHVADQRPESIGQLLDIAIEETLNGNFNPKIAANLPITQLADGHAQLENRATIGKVVVSWNAKV